MPTKQASKSKARRASASPRPTPLSPPHLYCTHRTYSTHSTVIGGGTSYRDCEGGGKGGSTHREPKKGKRPNGGGGRQHFAGWLLAPVVGLHTRPFHK